MTTDICDICFEEFYRCECDWQDEEYENHLVEVDIDIQPAITLLNQKGFRTKYCCSGHSENAFKNAYIMFAMPYQFKKLPEGWKYDWFYYRGIKKEYRHIIRPLPLSQKEINRMDEMELYDYLEKINGIVFDWAKGLDICLSENILPVNPSTRYEKEMHKCSVRLKCSYFPPYLCE